MGNPHDQVHARYGLCYQRKCIWDFGSIHMLFANKKDLMGVKTLLEMSLAKVQGRLEAGEDPTKADFWTHVLQNKGDQALSMAEMEANATAIG